MISGPGSRSLTFTLRFYEQTAAAIASVVDSAKRLHSGISGCTQHVDTISARPCTVVTLQFRDWTSLRAFRDDAQFVDVYLAGAWGRRMLTRDALRVTPAPEVNVGIIPSEMLLHVGL